MVKKVEKEHNVHHYLVVGRHVPNEKSPNPKIYKMRIFADDPVNAKCKFLYFLKRLDKVKKTSGQIFKGQQINLLVNLIKTSGEREDHTTEITCELQQDVTYLDQSVQGDFKCILSSLEEEKYYSLR